jgi:translation initiation factor 1
MGEHLPRRSPGAVGHRATIGGLEAGGREWHTPEKQTARLAIEKRKKGKVVTVVRGLLADENDLPALLGRLKAACGAGGTPKDDELEIQGDHLERLRGLLGEIGYRVRG